MYVVLMFRKSREYRKCSTARSAGRRPLQRRREPAKVTVILYRFESPPVGMSSACRQQEMLTWLHNDGSGRIDESVANGGEMPMFPTGAVFTTTASVCRYSGAYTPFYLSRTHRMPQHGN